MMQGPSLDEGLLVSMKVEVREDLRSFKELRAPTAMHTMLRAPEDFGTLHGVDSMWKCNFCTSICPESPLPPNHRIYLKSS